MAHAKMNTRYLNSNRGIIKLVEILIGVILSGWLIGGVWNGRYGVGSFNDFRLGYISTMNVVVVVLNIVFLVLNLVNLAVYKLEYVYSVAVCVLFLIASILVVWYMIEVPFQGGNLYVTAALVFTMFMLFLWDVKILQGEASN